MVQAGGAASTGGVPTERTVLVVTSDPAGPVVRHRFTAYAPALAEAGITLVVGAWPKDKSVRRETLAQAETADAVIVSSRLLARRHVRALRVRTSRLGFDFDDALPYRDSSRRASSSSTRRRRFAAIVKAADRITAGNAYLKGLVTVHARIARVIPTVVPTPPTPPTPEPDDGPLRIGWIGASSTMPYLEAAGPVFSQLAESGHEFCVRTIADRDPELPAGIMTESVPWRLEDWEQMLQEAHIGVAPLPDDAWTRGKCGLKVLQLLALGRPVVASAVGVQTEQIRPGETGFLARTDAELRDGLERLLEDKALRQTMGRAAHADVVERWSVAAWAPTVVREMQGLLDGERR